MKNVRVANSIIIKGYKNFKGEKKLIDFYLFSRNNEKLYAFSKPYTVGCYNLCKSGICVNELMSKRTRDVGMMNFVRYTKFIMPYLAEIYELKAA